MVRRLIAFDTTSRNSNLELIDYVRDYLGAHGVESRLVHDETKAKANLYATLGPLDRPGIALSGHTDVVPVDGQEWSSDPWTLTERDGRLHGRGACDMKGFIGVALAAVPEFMRRGLKTPIHIVLSYDEEVGCVGVRRLLATLRDMPHRPFAAIIGEPTSMKVTIGHKGKRSARARVRGLECHSSLAPTGVNAVEMAARIVVRLSDMGRRFAAEGPYDRDYDVAHTTVHTGVIHGGTALNIVPRDCHFDFEFRYLPENDPDDLFGELRRFVESDILPAMHKVSRDTGVAFEDFPSFPGLNTPEDSEIVQLVKALTGANAVGKVAFGTEAGLFQEADIATVICGPGSIEQAHKPDEYVSMEQLGECEAFMRRLMGRVCAA
jgi:acetylornithine deacetylase